MNTIVICPSHGSKCNTSMSSYDTITMNNSHDPKNDDGQASAVRPGVDCSVSVSNNVYIVVWCKVILHNLIEHRMYSILIINLIGKN